MGAHTKPTSLIFRQYEDKLPPFLLRPDPNIYDSDHYLVLDYETTVKTTKFSGKKGTPSALVEDNDTVCVSWRWGDSDEPTSCSFSSVFEQYWLVQACYEADYIVMHNAKFDLQWLARAGLDLRKVLVADTMIAEYVLTGNLKAGKRGALTLDTLAQLYLGWHKEHFIDICMKGGVCPSQMPESLLAERAIDDTTMTDMLWRRQRDRLRKEGLLPTFFTRCILTPVLADIETKGVHLDKGRVDKEYRAAREKMDELEGKLQVATQGRNPRSVPQMQEFLYDVLKFKEPMKRGVPWRPTGTDDVLANLKPTNKRQRDFIALKAEFAAVNADLTKNLEYFYAVTQETEDAVFYFQFNQCQTVTHRLSSSGTSMKFEMFEKAKGVQGQNLPRKYKKLFKARHDGWVMIEADGAQIEFRVAAFNAQEPVACQEIVNGFDVHLFTASQLNDVPIEAVDGDMRTNAKADTFKPLTIAA